LAVGSFTSVSLDPPLVAFLPDISSTSWPKIRESGSFCVNVLTHAQEDICRTMASKQPDKFSSLSWHQAGSGSPVLDDAAAWIDCDIEAVHEAGDHFIVIGRVRDLDVGDTVLPLIFYRGGYGRFSPRTLAANDADLVAQLAVVDLARGKMDDLSRELDVEVLASAVVADEIVLVASSGAPRTGSRPTRVGSRIPFLPPAGYVFAAWAHDDAIAGWIARLSLVDPGTDYDSHRVRLARVRQRGVSLGLAGSAHHELEIALGRTIRDGDTKAIDTLRRLVAEMAEYCEPEDPATAPSPVHTVAAPIFGPAGDVVLALALYGLPSSRAAHDLDTAVRRLTDATSVVTAAIGGTKPARDLGRLR
jgi:flavin reductase (DIM6/NTAB) family NADH-FMN oxidoreductase RutF